MADFRQLRAASLAAELDPEGKPARARAERRARDSERRAAAGLEGEPTILPAGVPPILPPGVIRIPAPVVVTVSVQSSDRTVLSVSRQSFDSAAVTDNALNPFTTYAFRLTFNESVPTFLIDTLATALAVELHEFGFLDVVFNPLEVVDIFPRPNNDGVIEFPGLEPLGLPGDIISGLPGFPEGEPIVPPGPPTREATLIVRSEKLSQDAIQTLLDAMGEVSNVKPLIKIDDGGLFGP